MPICQRIGQISKSNLTRLQTNRRLSEDASDFKVKSDEIADKSLKWSGNGFRHRLSVFVHVCQSVYLRGENRRTRRHIAKCLSKRLPSRQKQTYSQTYRQMSVKASTCAAKTDALADKSPNVCQSVYLRNENRRIRRHSTENAGHHYFFVVALAIML